MWERYCRGVNAIVYVILNPKEGEEEEEEEANSAGQPAGGDGRAARPGQQADAGGHPAAGAGQQVRPAGRAERRRADRRDGAEEHHEARGELLRHQRKGRDQPRRRAAVAHRAVEPLTMLSSAFPWLCLLSCLSEHAVCNTILALIQFLRSLFLRLLPPFSTSFVCSSRTLFYAELAMSWRCMKDSRIEVAEAKEVEEVEEVEAKVNRRWSTSSVVDKGEVEVSRAEQSRAGPPPGWFLQKQLSEWLAQPELQEPLALWR
ncbi:uncharacterized protein ARB_07931 [Trichophyton benhamiae CBS 112371]|uniref:Uncharacterized protein n=1 Tax=Arthroderma benhamiae (strain ATCC MYA-4681 / CBS 112371) TaxID=663331 RepID=D4AUL4_ARTBC|nr:uncharacterized protein ARB_07931 [Trichophyton benhamiae CBS 112371]EFE33179.1 hypothetical protein ARB_07931 [Trichophyton benhamiae CBS 112371]